MVLMRQSIGGILMSVWPGCSGHGTILSPPPRTAYLINGDVKSVAGSNFGMIDQWYNQGCEIGCPSCTGKDDGSCHNGKHATLPDSARTWRDSEHCGRKPWCAPGSAPVFSPCGSAGGGPERNEGAGGIPPPGIPQGLDGQKLPELKHPETKWQVGAVIETQWALRANHGGGYQYRLCPKDSKQTEECFQRTPMEFYGDHHEIQYCVNEAQVPDHPGADYHVDPRKHFPTCHDSQERQKIKALRVTEGVTPAGSTWTRNPIPACRTTNPHHPGGGASWCGHSNGFHADDFMFPPGGEDLSKANGRLLGGYGLAACDHANKQGQKCDPAEGMFRFNIVDKLVVPQVPPGDYTLSFRWDAEMGPQIWTMCSDVTILPGRASNVTETEVIV